jgi:hypothetical protein
MLSTVAELVEWNIKQKLVWSTMEKKKSLFKFLRLNVIKEYNMNMNSSDITDQLRGVYRPDHWLRNRKWWWSYFIWALRVAGVSAYKMYNVLYEEQRKLKNPDLPPKWTHMGFLEELVHDLLLPRETRRHVNMLKAVG